MSGISLITRQRVIERDQHRCVRCGDYLPFKPYSVHHRVPRQMGGSRHNPWIDQPGNLLTLCGSATTPGGCHTWVERHRIAAQDAGLIVRRPTIPSTVPVLTHQGWVLLDDDGYTTPTGDPR